MKIDSGRRSISLALIQVKFIFNEKLRTSKSTWRQITGVESCSSGSGREGAHASTLNIQHPRMRSAPNSSHDRRGRIPCCALITISGCYYQGSGAKSLKKTNYYLYFIILISGYNNENLWFN
jgi:hypothetical protein